MIGNLKKRWVALGPNMRLGLLSATALLLLLGGFGLTHLGFGAVRYRTLYYNLSPTAARQAITLLSSQKIPYQLKAGGTELRVPTSQYSLARVATAGQSGQSFQSFNKVNLGSTHFQRHILYIQALEAQLGTTISGMSGVNLARVSLTIPSTPLFGSSTGMATAAVFIRLAPFAHLSHSEVNAMIQLVTNSVPNLSAKNVTVVSSTGQVLTGTSTTAPVTTKALAVEASFERHLENHLTALLTPVLGVGNVVTTVRANLNMNQGTTTSTLFAYPPKGKKALLQSLQQLQVSFAGKGGANYVPGVGSNVPAYQAGGANGNSKYTKSQIGSKYALNKTVTQTVVAPGQVQRLSVAVVVNKALTAAQQKALVATVSAAIGAKAGRDTVSVTGLPFQKTKAAAKAKVIVAGLPWWIYLLVGLFVLSLILFLVFFLLRRGRKAALRVEQETLLELQMERERLLQAARSNTTAPVPALDEQTRNLEEKARSVPEQVANVLKLWLKENESGS